MNKKIFGYVRVSSTEQITTRQVNSLVANGVEEGNIFTDEGKTGKNFDRPQYQLLKKMLRAGDTLMVHELDRLGRNKRETLKEIQWFKDNGIRLKALNIPTTMMDYDNDLMLETINNIVIELYTMMAQQELETREKRQREGIDSMPVDEKTGKKVSAKTGIVTGRPTADYPANWAEVYGTWKAGEIKGTEAMKQMELKKTTFYKLVKQYEEGQ